MENKVYTHEKYGNFNYAVHSGNRKNADEKLPMLIFLHGAGERGDNYEKLYVHGPAKYIRNGTFLTDAIVICPQCPEGYVWNNLAPMLRDFITDMAEEYGADTSRISITGLSMGGYGTWEMIMFAPDMFYKAAPICGGGMSWRAYHIKAPVWTFHGNADSVVPFSASVEMVEGMKKCGLDVQFTVLHGVDHNSWEFAYEQTKVLDWLLN